MLNRIIFIYASQWNKKSFEYSNQIDNFYFKHQHKIYITRLNCSDPTTPEIDHIMNVHNLYNLPVTCFFKGKDLIYHRYGLMTEEQILEHYNKL